ncbi:hypothetical protein CMUS01_03750 [Colletotrichum musicola]|uniref:Uncharacterized protein n=1 Tax=Colletotrichum musicola TaxID=2175873 RepID=A0A8H6NQZ1_9PEZI|nr:hypothetical protein CMUS01_03750 [Colletotrichum musicola]
MASPPTLLSLPREIRDNIYEHYVASDGGLVCDSEKLIASRLRRTQDDRPIDVELVYTCKMIREEMKGFGLFLRFNTIHFSTVTSTDLRVLATRFDGLMCNLDRGRADLLAVAGYGMSKRKHEKLNSKYPQFAPLLDAIREDHGKYWGGRRPGWPYGEAPSLFRTFTKEVLETVTLSPIGAERLKLRRDEYFPGYLLRMVRCPVRHWTIPSEDDMQSLCTEVYESESFIKYIKRNGDRTKFRFSAAAAAIHFLQYLPATLRAQLRSIVLNEDHESVAKPQCHILGLIPFCQDNPLLRVERRVSLWNNAFLRDRRYDKHPEHRYQPELRIRPWALDAGQITRNIGQWIVEALALGPAGMPPSSFTVLLDGQPVPQQCAQIFQLTIQRDASWQAAWIESLSRGILPELSWFDRRCHTSGMWQTRVCVYPGYKYECLPQALRDIAENKSIVRCNFDVSEPWDVEKIIHENRSWTLEKWAEEWAKHEPATWEPAAPLPGLRAILERNLVPKKPRYRRGLYRDSTY